MALYEEAYIARDAVLSRSNELIQHAIAHDERVYLVCPQSAWANDRKIQSATLFPRGVSIHTWSTLFNSLWELWGNGRRVVSSALRTMLLTKAGDVLQHTPSDEEGNGDARSLYSDKLPRTRDELKPSFVNELSACLDEVAFGTPWEEALQGKALTLDKAEQEVMSIYRVYFELVNSMGRIDPVELEHLVAQRRFNNAVIIIEAPFNLSRRQQAIIKALGEQNEVWVLSDEGGASDQPHHAPELQQLAARLYKKAPGIAATGSVRVGEAVGPRATPGLVAQLISNALKDGHASEDIALVLPGVAGADPLIFEELARAGIPFAASYEVPLSQVLLGSTVLSAFELAQQAGEMGDRHDAELLYQLVSSPYFSTDDGSDAWDLQRTWRGERALEHPKRLQDALKRSTPELETLMRLAGEKVTGQWKEALNDCLNQMLLNAVSSKRRSSANSNDDAACIRALMYFVEEILPASAPCSSEVLAQIKVELNRSYAGLDPALSATEHVVSNHSPCNERAKMQGISLITPEELGLHHYAVVIMGNLSADAYPMSEKPSSLSSLMKKLEREPQKNLASRQRATLLHTLEAATDSFIFYRETYDANGDEARQSALWDELLANYQSAETAAATVGSPERIPPALEPCALRVYEGNWLKDQARSFSIKGSKLIERGELTREAIEELFVEPISPTALERYLQCPYAWFINKRLRARSIDESFDAAHLGSFVHEVLQRFYGHIIAEGMRRVTPQNLPVALDMLDTLYVDLQREYASEGRQLAASATEQVTLDALLSQIRELIKRDATFLPGFEPRYLEAFIGSETVADYAGVKIAGCIDRIDVNAEGQAVIIDYKMSTDLKHYGLPHKGVVFPHYLQGAIYARVAEREFGLTPIGSLYRSYSRASTRGVFEQSLISGIDKQTLKEQGMSLSDAIPWSSPETLEDEGEESVTALDYTVFLDKVEDCAREAVRRIRQGDIFPHPTTDSICRYCAVAQNCSKRRGGDNTWR